MNEKTNTGLKGEVFCRLWLLNHNDLEEVMPEGNCIGIDGCYNYNNKIINLQFKCCLTKQNNQLCFKLTDLERTKSDYIKANWDYVLLTDLKDIWILPYEYLKRKPSMIYISKNKIQCFKNNIDILRMDEKELMNVLIDNHLVN